MGGLRYRRIADDLKFQERELLIGARYVVAEFVRIQTYAASSLFVRILANPATSPDRFDWVKPLCGLRVSVFQASCVLEGGDF
jgi:hypothetical protein